jgi:membrane protein DedA with SNARE-associated domain
LIGTNHPDEAKTIIIIIWIAGMVIGAFIGSLLAYMWGQYISRTGDASQAATRVKPQQ